MAVLSNDRDRTRFQIEQMRALAERERRVGLLTAMATRRAVPRGGGALPRRVPMRMTETLSEDARDPVLVVPGRVLLRGDPTSALAALDRDGIAASVSRSGDAGRSTLLSVPDDADIADVVDRLKHAGVQASADHAAAHSGRSKGGNTPKRTDAPPASPRRRNDHVCRRPLVVVVDTGVDRAAIQQASAAEGNRTDGWLDGVWIGDPSHDIDLLDTENYAGEDVPDGCLDLGAGHGTFVAGVVRTCAPTANVVVLRALDTDGYGSESAVEAAITRARVLFERAGGPGLLNLSLGIETIDAQPPVGVTAAIEALPGDVLVIAAAGNGATEVPMWPAALDGVLGVASVGQTPNGFAASDWSNYGRWVDFSAPGDGVASTFVAGTETRGTGRDDDPFDPDPDTFDGPNAYALWSGTSFATAKVSGALAAHLIDDHETSIDQAVDALRANGTPLDGYGLALAL